MPSLLTFCTTLKFYNDPLCGGDLPDQWKTSIIIPIPKKGDLTKTDSYRGIALTSIPGKILNRMILNRIKPPLETILRRHQNGFRPGRSCASHILALQRILEGAAAKNLPAVMTFVDFRQFRQCAPWDPNEDPKSLRNS